MRIIVNPAAAGGRAGKEWPAVAGLLADRGISFEPVFTEAPWHAVELAAEAVGEGADIVVAVGGDGTVCEVAEGLHRAGGGTLAILPMGTGNDVGRTYGVPSKLEEAMAVLVDGTVKEMDLIRSGDHVVLNAIGIGLTGDINRRAAGVKYFRGIGVYLATAVVSLFFYRSPAVRVETPDQSWQGRISIIAIHNGPTTGGGFRLTPDAVPDDGLLDLCLIEGMGAFGRLPRLMAAMRGTLSKMSGTVEMRAPLVELLFDEPLPIHLDGNQDLLEPPSARFEVLPGAIRVLVP